MPAQSVTFAVIRTSTHPGHSSSTHRTASARTKSHGANPGVVRITGVDQERHRRRMSAIAAERDAVLSGDS